MKKLTMSVGLWMPHYEEVKDVSRLVNATLWDMHGQWSGELKLFYFFQHFCVEYIKQCAEITNIAFVIQILF